MKKIFVCLANSKKYGGRCLAGIELTRDEQGKPHLTLDAQGKPRWIRPVAHTEHGEIPQMEVKHIRLLDFVEFESAEPCPHGYQTENIFYQGKTFDVCGNLNVKSENLDQLVENQSDIILGNREKYISASEVDALGHSIVLIKTDTSRIKLYETGAHLRMAFFWQNTAYDLPVTDMDFHLRWIDEPTILHDKPNAYLCISLAINFEGRHHKFISWPNRHETFPFVKTECFSVFISGGGHFQTFPAAFFSQCFGCVEQDFPHAF